jgi:hypothetical protein
MIKRLRNKKALFLILSLFCASRATQAQASQNAELVVPVFEASQIISPVIIPAVSIYRIWNATGERTLVRTAALPAGVAFDPSYISPDNFPTCIFPGQMLDPDKSCMVRLIISKPVQDGWFGIAMGNTGSAVPINVEISSGNNPLSTSPERINLSSGKTADLFVSNPTSGFTANNVKVMLPAPIAERVAKVAYSGCDWLPVGSVCKVTLLAKADIATPAVGWIRVVSANTRTQTVAIQIGASK